MILSLKCPHCGKSTKSVVLETRDYVDGVARKRACGFCGKSFVTVEKVDVTAVIKRKRENVKGENSLREPRVKKKDFSIVNVWR